MNLVTRSIQCVKTKYPDSANAEVIYSDIPQNDTSQLSPWHGMKSKGLRPAFAAVWIFWSRLCSAEQRVGECRCNIFLHLSSADWSESKPVKVAELFSALSYQRTCNFCGFIVRSELTRPCAWQGDKCLCLGTLALYFSLYNGHARNCLSQDPYRDQSCSLQRLFGISVHPENATEIVTGFQ